MRGAVVGTGTRWRGGVVHVHAPGTFSDFSLTAVHNNKARCAGRGLGGGGRFFLALFLWIVSFYCKTILLKQS